VSSAPAPGPAGEPAGPPPPARRGLRVGSRRLLLMLLVIVLAGGGAAVAVAGPFAPAPTPGTGTVGGGQPSGVATVTSGTLSSQTQVDGTLGYAGSYSVVNQATGTFTALPGLGQVIRQGQSLYQVNGQPVVLLYGATPAYRALSSGVTGADVRQLNADLVALGYATRSELNPASDYFGSATATAVEALQDHLGVTQTGTLALGQVVFLPSRARISEIDPALGSSATPGTATLSATSTTRQVTVDLDTTEQSYVAPGDKVTITLADNAATPGVVTSISNVATSSGSDSSGSGSDSSGSGSGSSGSGSGSSGTSGSGSSDSGSGSGTPTVTVEIAPLHPSATGVLDSEPVQVSITTATVPNVLAVPVDALLALAGSAGGRYAVEVTQAGGSHRLVHVSLGLFDDAAGLVQVTGSGLSAGQRVVVPAT